MPYLQHSNYTMTAEQIKEAAAGRWPEILSQLGGIDTGLLDGRHHPCPKCGGRDRFRALDSEAGALFCNRCFSSGNGDGLAALQWLNGWDFQETLREVADYLGLRCEQQRKRIKRAGSAYRDLVRLMAGYGAERVGDAVVVPAYDQDGRPCTKLRIWPYRGDRFRKGLLEKDKPAGLFLPRDEWGNVMLPQPGQRWVLAEGVKDASALRSLGYLAAGLPTCRITQNGRLARFAPLFAGCRVVLIPDLDKPGQEGAKTTAQTFAPYCDEIRIARLPGEITEKGGKDVRDILKQKNGEQLVRSAVENARRVGADGEPLEEVEFSVISCGELMQSNFRVSYLVDGVLAAGQPCLVAGPFKSLKTSLLVDLGVSLATGSPFLGFFDCAPARVGMMSGETALPVLRDILRRVCESKGLVPEKVGGLVFAPQVPILHRADHLEALQRWIDQNALAGGVLTIDPAYLAMPGMSESANNVFAVGELLRPVSELCQELGVTLVICHHTRKHIGNEPPQLSDVAWAGWAEWARQWVLLNRREKYDPDQGEHKLWLAVGGSAGHGGQWALDVYEAPPPRRGAGCGKWN